MTWIKLKDIDEKLDNNRLNILEEVNKSNIQINDSIDKVYKILDIIKDNIDESNNMIVKEVNMLKESELTLDKKINDLDNKLNHLLTSIQTIGLRLDKTIKDLNNNVSKNLNKECKETKDSLKEINSELRNLSELTKILIVNDMASIVEDKKELK